MVKALPSIAGGAGLIPGWRTKIPHASWPRKQNIKQKQCADKDFEGGPHQKIFRKINEENVSHLINNFSIDYTWQG